MAKVEVFKREYIINRDYRKDAQAILRIPAWGLIEKSDMINIIKEFLKKENLQAKRITTINGIPEVDIDGYTIEAIPVKNYSLGTEVLKVKLYKHVIKYDIEEEVELPF